MKYIRASVRFFLFAAATLGLYAIWFVAAPFINNRILWRQTIFYLWARAFAGIAKMRVEVAGTPPEPPFFLVANH